MKTNLKNDIYYIRFIIPIFLFSSFVYTCIHKEGQSEMLFELALPMIYAAATPVIMYFTDERSRWISFSAGLPGRRFGYIHAKYISSGSLLLTVMAASVICLMLIKNNELNTQMPLGNL